MAFNEDLRRVYPDKLLGPDEGWSGKIEDCIVGLTGDADADLREYGIDMFSGQAPEGDWDELVAAPRDYLEEDLDMILTLYKEFREKLSEIAKVCDGYRWLDTPLTGLIGKLRPKDVTDYCGYLQYLEEEDRLSDIQENKEEADDRTPEDLRKIISTYGERRWRRYIAARVEFFSRNTPKVGYVDEDGYLVLPADMRDDRDDDGMEDEEKEE